jgi:hypothetical protein
MTPGLVLPSISSPVSATRLSDSSDIGFAAVAEAFTRAVASLPSVEERWVTVAGRPVRVRVAGLTLAAQLANAWPHAAEPPADGTAALTVDLWDEDATGVGIPGGAVSDLLHSRDGRFVHHGLAHVASWLDRAGPRLVACFVAPAARHPARFYQPFGPLLAMWLADVQAPAIHAGAVSIDGGGIVLTGRAGAGKSTAAISCLLAGCDYLGDDFVAITEEHDGTARVHGVYGMAHVVASQVDRFPALPARFLHTPDVDGGKAVVDLAGAFPGRVVPEATIRAIVLPRILAGATTRVRPASKVDAMIAMAPASLFMRGAATPRAFHSMARLIERVPAYWLEMGPDLTTIPAVLRPLMEAE